MASLGLFPTSMETKRWQGHKGINNYFYCPTSKSEVTGFDSYHLIQYGDKVQLWFGEAKFRTKYHQSICEIIKKLSLTIWFFIKPFIKLINIH